MRVEKVKRTKIIFQGVYENMLDQKNLNNLVD